MCVCVFKSLQSCPTLCDPMDYSPPGSSVHGILQPRILEWVAMPSSRGSSCPGIEPASVVSCIGRQVLYHECHLGGVCVCARACASPGKLLCVCVCARAKPVCMHVCVCVQSPCVCVKPVCEACVCVCEACVPACVRVCVCVCVCEREREREECLPGFAVPSPCPPLNLSSREALRQRCS